MKRLAALVVAVVVIGGLIWFAWHRIEATAPPGTLYGNVEIRQVDLSFNAEGTVATMTKREGDKVKQGETIAALDPATYQSAYELAAARRDAAKAQLDVLLAGTRSEDIDEARANLAAAQASLANAEASFERQKGLAATNATTKQLLDDARMALDSGRAKVDQMQVRLTRALNGPRPEDIEAARAQLRAAEATVDLSRTQLERTKLMAPANGTVMTRVIEPGTVVLPAASIYAMALDDEVWVRAFAPEPLLSRVAPGTEVTLTTDGTRKSYRGRIGYVSPAAEFTPKTVETPELRTQLVYRLRIRVENPDNGVRQGMPMTITLPPVQ
ncbi:MAG TPA: efflux RND transporter periplasmic adaptor subunit [Acetobacteraceae bacterium]|jgi:HlyD family secretion protein|nr:efflux RND transporter periplasmic adaptor subunit [Acetobacteraceae bacterium]